MPDHPEALRQALAALEWYADEARACEKHSHSGQHGAPQAMLASVSVLALDGGRRADAAIATLRALAEKPADTPMTREQAVELARAKMAIFHGIPLDYGAQPSSWVIAAMQAAYAQGIAANSLDARGEPVAWRVRFHTDDSLAGKPNVRPWVLLPDRPVRGSAIESEPLYTRPLVPLRIVTNDHEERVTFYVGDLQAGQSFTYDSHGSEGLRSARNLVRDIGRLLDISVEEEEQP